MKQLIMSLALAASTFNTKAGLEYVFDKTVPPLFQEAARAALRECPPSESTVQLTIIRLRAGIASKVERSVVRVAHPVSRTLSSLPSFYSRIYFGREGYYRGTSRENSLFVTASGASGVRYHLFTSSDLLAWTDASATGSGLFVIQVDASEQPKQFFRFSRDTQE